MRWQGQRESGNVEDRRRMSAPRRGAAIGGGGLLLLIAFALLTGEDPIKLLESVQNTQVSLDSEGEAMALLNLGSEMREREETARAEEHLLASLALLVTALGTITHFANRLASCQSCLHRKIHSLHLWRLHLRP